jgi:hypothetical protein
MTYQPHYISAFDENSGYQTYDDPFLLPEKAFPILENAYVWRNKVQKRNGLTTLGRLRRLLVLQSLGNTGASPWSFNIYTVLAIAEEPYAEIELGSVIITIAGPIVFTDDGTGNLVSVTPGNSGTINYATGDVVLTHTAGAGVATTIDFAYFPSLPCMGLRRQETDIVNEEKMIAFDTKYAYVYTPGFFIGLPSTTTTIWHGTDYQFFWSVNYWRNAVGKLFWATNFNATNATPDPIRYYDTVTWTNFTPYVAADHAVTPATLYQAKILIVYKNRMVAMNTYETVGGSATLIHHPNRIRFSQNGDPTVIGVVAAGPVWTTIGAWASDIPGYGGWIDLPTAEQIVTAEFCKDVLLVKCERSSYKIIYTGIPSIPFIFEKINADFGAESTFSQIAFDSGVLTIGNTGITQDDSVNVVRIDQKIPNFVFDIYNKNHGTERVHGAREFAKELAIWIYPDIDENIPSGLKTDPTAFPNKMLVYNYRNSSYAIFDDYFTCLGYFQRPSDLTWSTIPYFTWSQWSEYWDSGTAQAWYPSVVAGNQQGYVFNIFNDVAQNDISLSIKSIVGNNVTVHYHNLPDGSFVEISDILSVGLPDLTIYNDYIAKVNVVDQDTIKLLLNEDPITGDKVPTFVDGGAGTSYIGSGHLTVKTNFNITTKVFTPFYDQASQARLGHIDFLLLSTTDGEITSNVMINECDSLYETDPSTTRGNLGSNVLLTRPESNTLAPYQNNQSKIWHRKYVQSIFQNFQIQLSMSDEQMYDAAIADSNFILYAMIFHLSKNARLIQ